jgi:hypothetical protein
MIKKILILAACISLVNVGLVWAEEIAATGTTPTAVAAMEKSTPALATPRSVLQAAPQAEKIETLLDGNVYAHGGYAGPGVKVTTIDGKTECMVGGRFGCIMNHNINIGFAGYGLATDQFKREINGTERRLGMGYGGLDVGYTFAPNSLVHVTFQTLIGAGGIGYAFRTDRWSTDHDQGHWESDIEGDAFFVVEPMLWVELNVTKWFRLCLGGGYRYIDGVDENIVGINAGALRGANGEILFKYGFF